MRPDTLGSARVPAVGRRPSKQRLASEHSPGQARWPDSAGAVLRVPPGDGRPGRGHPTCCPESPPSPGETAPLCRPGRSPAFHTVRNALKPTLGERAAEGAEREDPTLSGTRVELLQGVCVGGGHQQGWGPGTMETIG